jgi:putative ABC transport system substrate-binding protein
VPLIGFLSLDAPHPNAAYVAAFHKGLAEAGYIEDQNTKIEYRWAEGESDRVRVFAAELVRRNVAVIFASGGALAPAIAAKAATSTIPIVFAIGGDPVKYGLVASLSRPGGNITGVMSFGAELSGKRFELLCEMVPQAKTIAYLSGGPGFTSFEEEWTNVLGAANMLGRKLAVVNAATTHDIEAAFATLLQRKAEALIVGVTPHLFYAGKKILAQAARYKVPGTYSGAGWCRGGGLMSYNGDYLAQYHRAGQYVGQILHGAKPADLPVQQPTKFELVINVKTAKALGITVPPSPLARANEVIE